MLKRNTLGFKILLSTIAIAFVVLNSMIPLQASANSVNGLENQLGDMANTYEETTKEVTEDIQNEYTEKAKQLIETGQVDVNTPNNMEYDYNNVEVSEVNENYYMVKLNYVSNSDYHKFSGLSLTFDKSNTNLVNLLEVHMQEIDSNSGSLKAWLNGDIKVDEIVETEKEHQNDGVSTFGFWSDFSDCLNNQGVSSWAITALSVLCSGVCVGTGGAGCAPCLYSASFVTGGTIGYCLGDSI